MVRIVTDSSTLITADEAREMGIDVIPLCVSIGDMEGRDLEVDMDDFYGRIDRKEIPRRNLVKCNPSYYSYHLFHHYELKLTYNNSYDVSTIQFSMCMSTYHNFQ